MTKIGRLASSFTLVTLLLAGYAFAQTDPGVQSASRGTGAALSSVLSNSPSGILAFFTDGQTRFQEVETVSNSANVGLGPRFNANQCSICHAQPAIGGTGSATGQNPRSEREQPLRCRETARERGASRSNCKAGEFR